MHKSKIEPTHLNKNERLWTINEVCEFLGLGRSTVYVMVAQNELPHLKVQNKLRFIPEQLWAWAKKKSAS